MSPVCRLCSKEFPADEIGAHLISDHPPKTKGRMKMVVDELKSLNRTLKRLESQGIALADYAQGLRKLANAMGVIADEVLSLQREQMALSNDFGDHLLSHEREYPTGAELKEYLAFMREERKK